MKGVDRKVRFDTADGMDPLSIAGSGQQSASGVSAVREGGANFGALGEGDSPRSGESVGKSAGCLEENPGGGAEYITRGRHVAVLREAGSSGQVRCE